MDPTRTALCVCSLFECTLVPIGFFCFFLITEAVQPHDMCMQVRRNMRQRASWGRIPCCCRVAAQVLLHQHTSAQNNSDRRCSRATIAR